MQGILFGVSCMLCYFSNEVLVLDLLAGNNHFCHSYTFTERYLGYAPKSVTNTSYVSLYVFKYNIFSMKTFYI